MTPAQSASKTLSALPRLNVCLSLAGAVSGGAYIAGALAFIVEALDAWEAARGPSADDGEASLAPQHRVVLCGVAGTSSGSLTAAALTAVLDRHLPVVDALTPPIQASRHPLYHAWVDATDITDLLGKSDARPVPVASVLDARHLEKVAAGAIRDVDTSALPRLGQFRAWLAEPFRVAFAVTDLRGAPYALAVEQSPGHAALAQDGQSLHATSMHYAVSALGGEAVQPAQASERGLAFASDPRQNWDAWGWHFAEAALGSAAFPLVLAARTLRRPVADLDAQRFGLEPTAGPPALPRKANVAPAWTSNNPAPVDGDYRFACVDGGLLQNNPVVPAREILRSSGVLDDPVNPSAVVMIDPKVHAGAAGATEAGALGFLGVARHAFRAVLSQAGLCATDLTLESDPTVFSRAILSPASAAAAAGDNSSRRLAGAFLGGFGGYFCQAFRRHDYLLGRHDAQRWLAEGFVFPATHPLFAGWTPAQRAHFARADGCLPVIPLVGSLHPKHGRREGVPEWPAGQFEPESIRHALGERLDILVGSALARSRWRVPGRIAWKVLLRRPAMSFLLRWAGAAMKAHNL